MKLDEITGSKSFLARNATLLAALAAGAAARAEPGRRSQSPNCRLDRPTPRLGYCVTIIQCRHRLLDAHDSLPFSVKPLVDCVTEWLGYASDSDPALRWEYGQIETKGQEGVIVRIQLTGS